jgi:hypothetical protein
LALFNNSRNASSNWKMPNDWNVDIAGVRGSDGAAGPVSSLTDAPSDGNLYGRANAAWASGGKTGNINITLGSSLVLNKPGSTWRNVFIGATNGVTRWEMVLGDATAESGSNVGSDFRINRFNDAGTQIDTSLLITRSSGVTSIPHCLEVSRSQAPTVPTALTGTLSCPYFICWANNYSINAWNDGAGNWRTINALQPNAYIWSISGNGGLTFLYSQNQPGANGIVTGWNASVIFDGVGIMYPTRQGTNSFAFDWGGVTSGLGSVGIDNNVWYPIANAASDARLKQDVKPSQLDCVATLKKIPLYQYRWKDHTEPGKPKEVERKANNLIPVGLVAQRLHDVAPHLAQKPKPEQKEDQIHVWSIDQANTLALLVGTVQQLSERVECLTTGTSTSSE